MKSLQLPFGTFPAPPGRVLECRTQSRPTILVIDDEDGPREALRMVMRPHFDVLLASGGEEALRIIGRNKVDVATLDLRMPGLDGVGTLERIREIDPQLEVVIITGFGSKESVMDTIYLGAHSYLNKPFHASEVLDAVRRALDDRHRPDGTPDFPRATHGS